MGLVSWITCIGLVLMLLGLVAAAVAPKGSGSADPDDDAIQPWTAVLFVVGLLLGLGGGVSIGISQDTGWDPRAVLAILLAAVGALIVWGFVIWWLTRKSDENWARAEEIAREGARDE